MKKTNMATFINYLEYKLEIKRDLKTITEEQFKTLKEFFFAGEEGYEFEGDYEDFKKYLEAHR